ncbi:hypothetical protein ISM_08095 [Roseovarius nubinhibens ISM]|uniref:Uncharacterized protein n=1 Tax=Roseovarius nubinhibens (strain ATCC BAA-591 / DSM 15170 / ISM) TaxID=89187 RepID=A3SLL1_ROSNI|nr:hypothetical protein ISM_08095 [Roseovarius nubinhibens ISM]
MSSDPFELVAAIKRVERERDVVTFCGPVLYALVAWWNLSKLSTGESLILAAIAFIGILVIRETKAAQLQSLRVSLRHIELMRDPALASNDSAELSHPSS